MVSAERDGLEGYGCESCPAHAVILGPLRRGGIAPDERLLSMWRAARDQQAQGRACPACAAAMVVVHNHTSEGVSLEICTACKILCFDPSEQETILTAERELSVASSRSAPPPQPSGLRDSLLAFMREDWKLIVGLLIATLFGYVALYDGPDRARCAATCHQSGYAAFRLLPAHDGRTGSYPARCYCLTEEESKTSQGVSKGVEVSF